MSITTKYLKQNAVYFAAGPVGRNGQYTYEDPVAIKVRWHDEQVEFLDKNKAKQVSKAVVFVGQDVTLLGVLWLGDIDDLTSDTEPFKNSGAYEIRGFVKIPRLRKLTDFLRVVYL